MRRAALLALACAAALAAASAASAAPLYVVKGKGWGHGIGLSQYGAQGYARSGWGHRRILAHYYPGTRLAPAPTDRVRVLLAASRKRVVVGSTRPFRVVDATGRTATLPAGRVGLGPKLRVKIRGKHVALASPVRFEPGAAPLSHDGAGYRGQLVVRSRAGLMSVVNHVGLERYLRGVVPWEMPSHWHPEALRAQAVVARSYALATRKPGKIFDLHADVRSQVYGGIRAEKRSTNLALGATSGKVLWHGGSVATTFYHSTSGGRTAAVRDVWPKAAASPYLRAVPDPWSRLSPHDTWVPIALTAPQLGKRLGLAGAARLVRVERNGSGRAARLVVRTRAGERAIPAADVRTGLELRSTWFSVGVLDLQRPQPGAAGRLVLRGTARGVRGPVVQRREAGTWRTVANVKPDARGRFATTLPRRPGAAYRLAAEGHAAPPVMPAG